MLESNKRISNITKNQLLRFIELSMKGEKTKCETSMRNGDLAKENGEEKKNSREGSTKLSIPQTPNGEEGQNQSSEKSESRD